MSNAEGYDLIGDIHGCAKTLEELLSKLGYSKVNGIYRHRNRRVIFIGDIVDRGPRIREALHIVRDMVVAGSAEIVMGNHEYNALGYCTLAPPGSGRKHLREHTARHTRLIAETLQQFENYPAEWREFLEWFYEIPLFIEKKDFRVVHACWDQNLIDLFRQQYPDHCIDEKFLHDSTANGSFAARVMDRLTRGTDLRLPDGESIVGKDGLERHFFRTKFWSEKPQIYGDVVFQPDPLTDSLFNRELSPQEKQRLLHYPESERPVFVGHYWMSGCPDIICPNVVCLDYSAVKYGKLVAYRMDGEQHLCRDKFVWVDVLPS